MDSLIDRLQAAVNQPAHLARGLPNDCYVDETFFKLEQQRLFGRTWTAVAVASEVPHAGDVKPVMVAGQPLVLVRDRAGSVRVFHNVCRHRGMALVEQACSGQATLRCPYHSWAYGLDGALLRTPFIGGPGTDSHPDFDRTDKGLFAVRSAVQWDIVFVDLSGKAPPLEAHLAPLARRLGYLDMTLWQHGALEDSVGRFELKANWKLAMENFCESYHLPWVHPNLNSYSKIEDHYHLFGDRLFAGQGTTVYSPLETGNGAFPIHPGFPPETRRGAEYYAVLPNFWIGLQCDHLYVVILEAPAPDRVIETLHLYYLGGAARDPAFAPLRQRNTHLWSQVFAEDVGVVEGMQRGRHSHAFDGGLFTPAMDTPTQHFHRVVAAALAA